MREWFWCLSVLVGFSGVLQGAINRRLSESNGLTLVVLVNAAVMLALSLVFLVLLKWKPEIFPSAFAIKPVFVWSFWSFVPGILGFLIVTGAPWAISQLGAFRVFLAVVAAQMLLSVLWDHFLEQITVEPRRILAALLTVLIAWWGGR